MGLAAFDTADLVRQPAKVKALGYSAIGLYLREDRAPAAIVRVIRDEGLRIFSIAEKGEATVRSYFTAVRGLEDGQKALEYARSIGQQVGTTISPAVDYDSNPSDVMGYLESFHDAIKSAGYYCLPYGNGATLQAAIDKGFAVGGYLSQSTGHSGYKDFYSKAAIRQGPSKTILGMDCDLDLVILQQITVGGVTVRTVW